MKVYGHTAYSCKNVSVACCEQLEACSHNSQTDLITFSRYPPSVLSYGLLLRTHEDFHVPVYLLWPRNNQATGSSA